MFRHPHYISAISVLIGVIGLSTSLMLSNAREFGLLFNTLRLVLWVELITLPVALMLAVLIARTNLVSRQLVSMLISSLLLMPLYLQLCGWDAAFGVLGWFTLARVPRSEPFLSGFRAAVVIHTVYAIPWATWMMAAMFRYGRREWEEQALLEGSGAQVWRCITLPQLASGVLLAAVWVFVLTAGEMTVTNIYMVRTYAENVYSYFAGSGDLEAVWPHVSSLLIFIMSLVCLAFAALLQLPAHLQEQQAYRWQLRYSQSTWFVAAFLCVAMLVGFPLINLITQAGMQVTAHDGHPERSWSLVKTGEILLLTPRKFSREFGATLNISLTVTLLSLLIGSYFAWITSGKSTAWHRMRGFGCHWRLASAKSIGHCQDVSGTQNLAASFAWFLAAVGLAMPAPIIGIAVIRLLNQPSSPLLLWLYDRTILPPVLALLVRCVPVAYLGLWWAWRSLDHETLATAELEGAGDWRRFLSIALPQRWSVVSMLALMIFAIASGDLSASILTLPPGMSTIAQRMFGLLHSGVNDQVAGIGLVSWAAYLVLGRQRVKSEG